MSTDKKNRTSMSTLNGEGSLSRVGVELVATGITSDRTRLSSARWANRANRRCGSSQASIPHDLAVMQLPCDSRLPSAGPAKDFNVISLAPPITQPCPAYAGFACYRQATLVSATENAGRQFTDYTGQGFPRVLQVTCAACAALLRRFVANETTMNRKNIPRYIKACLAAAVRTRPRAYLRMLSQSPYTVAALPQYGINMLVDVRDPAISKPILALGEYERCFAARLLDFVSTDTCFLDVGANIGFFSLVVARRAVNGKVWSIEPDPQNIRLLRASVALNGLDKTIDVRHQAASNTEEEVFLSTLGYGANLGARFTAKDESILQERSLAGAPEPVKVRSQSMDAALQGHKLDLVKIDVEGHEPFVLQGMSRILSENRPVVFSEYAPGTIEHISKTDPVEMLRYMQDHNYEMWIVDEQGNNLPQESVDGVMKRYKKTQHHLDLLFTPKELANKIERLTKPMASHTAPL